MIEIDGHHLTVDQVVRVARNHETAVISEIGKANIALSRHWLEAILATDRPVYGINTGLAFLRTAEYHPAIVRA